MSLARIWLIGLVRGSFREAGTQEEVKMTFAVAAGYGITICLMDVCFLMSSSGVNAACPAEMTCVETAELSEEFGIRFSCCRRSLAGHINVERARKIMISGEQSLRIPAWHRKSVIE